MYATQMPQPVDQGLAIRRQVRSNIPFLRRFGRALTGDQRMADLCVVQLMEDLLSEKALMALSANPRVALFKWILHILKDLSQHGGTRADPTLLMPPSRQGYLLTTVEGFSHAAAAEVLDVTPDELSTLLNELKAEIALQPSTDVLIIEDEAFIALDLECIVKSLGHNVVGKARTHTEAIASIEPRRPALILSDIQLADGSNGFDAVNEILVSGHMPVIFITAFPERLLTGRQDEPAYLITKPFDTNAVRATISQALFLSGQAA